MKQLLFGIMFFALVIVVSIPAMAAVDINVTISLPPPISFAAPPDVIVMPDTDDVYVVPDIDVDMFFWDGWWWRLWEGRWYRSQYYDRGWGYYNNVPSFYFDVDPGWRGYYREHDWYGHRWNYDRIPYGQLQHNWKSWHNDRHWERQGTWGVHGYTPRPAQQRQGFRQQRQQQYQQRPEVRQHQQQRQELRQQRQQQYQKRPEVQQHQQQRQQQQKQPQVQKPQGQPQRQPQAQQPRQQPAQQPHQEKAQQPQRQPQAQQPQHSKPQGQPAGGEAEHRK